MTRAPTPCLHRSRAAQRRLALAACLFVLATAACGGDASQPGVDTVNLDANEPVEETTSQSDAAATPEVATPGDSAAPGPATWHKDVRPLVARSCNGCHADGGIGGLRLDDLETLGPIAPLMVGRVMSGEMPPWPMDPGCREVEGARFLTEAERAVFAAWRDGGYQSGTPSDFAELPPRDPPRGPAREPDLLLTRSEGYAPDAALSDDYRCFVFDTEVAADTWVSGVDVLPDVVPLVHHALVYVVPPDRVARVLQRDAASDGLGYPCLGGVGAGGSESLLAGWVPGMQPMHFPEGAALRVAAGSRFVVQMHYNTFNAPENAPMPTDATRVALWTLAAGETPRESVTITPIADGDLAIRPGEREVIEGATVTSPASATIIGVIPHMHLLGRSISLTVRRALTSEEHCVADIPRWDFHWQQVYQFKVDDHLPLYFGDAIALRCVYDNSAENQAVVDGVRQTPRLVTWGEGTLDEMCLAYLVTTSPWGEAAAGRCPGSGSCIKACPAEDVLCAVECLASAGQDCAECALEPLFIDCGRRTCGLSLAALGACIQQSPTPEDSLGAAFNHCRAELDAHYACLEPQLRAGACDEDLAACDLTFSP